GGDARGAAAGHPAERVPPADRPDDSFGERADALIQARPASTAHVAFSPLDVASWLLLAGMVAKAAAGAGSMQDRAKARTSAALMTDPAARTTPTASMATSSGVAETRYGSRPSRRAGLPISSPVAPHTADIRR